MLWVSDFILLKVSMILILAIIYLPGFLINKFFYIIFTFPLTCWIYGITAFQVKLDSKGLNSEEILKNFEENWLYYMGFGFISTIFTFFIPFFESTALIAMFLPLMCITAVKSEPSSPQKFFPKIPFTHIIWNLILNKIFESMRAKAASWRKSFSNTFLEKKN